MELFIGTIQLWMLPIVANLAYFYNVQLQSAKWPVLAHYMSFLLACSHMNNTHPSNITVLIVISHNYMTIN